MTIMWSEKVYSQKPQMAPYGSWKSPITTDMIVSETIDLSQIILDGESVYWVEMRPAEKGRYVVVKRDSKGGTKDITPGGYNARTRVHEYGGGSFTVDNDTIYFSNFQDHRVYRQSPGLEPEAISPEADFRYADLIIDRFRKRLICVCEDPANSGREAINTLIGLSLDGSKKAIILASGTDFYASPRLSPEGSRLAWLSWNHPNMPWDGTELRVAEINSDGTLGESRRVAGGPDESIFQPEWSPDGMLYFVSDRTGWWNLYRWKGRGVEPVIPMEAEFGLPQWLFGMSTHAFESADRLICTYHQYGKWHLASLDTSSGGLRVSPLTPTLSLQGRGGSGSNPNTSLAPVSGERVRVRGTKRKFLYDQVMETPYTEFSYIRAGAGQAVFLAAGPSEFPAIVRLDMNTGEWEVVRRSSRAAIDSGYLSIPEPIEFPTEQGLTAYGFFYRPKNSNFTGPSGQRPPLLVVSHGGPTGASSSALNLKIQYWTSRGIAVLDVDYGGSTGYGRAYRQRLNGRWGVVDVDDCVSGAHYLVERGEVDSNRLAIRGSSAGGYTTLSALAFRDVFKAGASYYGVSDLESLAKDTHKFESRYLDRLIGPYPERRDIYLHRSPIHSIDRFSCPVIFLQGLEDKIVPADQAERMVDALRAKGIPVAYLTFEGEQHGFRGAESIKRALDAELYFYSRIFGFPLSDPIDPVPIENL